MFYRRACMCTACLPVESLGLRFWKVVSHHLMDDAGHRTRSSARAISPIPWENILMWLAHFIPGDFTLNVAWHDKHSYFTSSLGVWVCRGFKTDFLPMGFSLVRSPEASPWDIRLFPVLWEKCFLQAQLLLSLFRSLFHMILAFWCRLLLSWGPLGNTSCNSRSYTCNSSSIKHLGSTLAAYWIQG